MSTPTSDEHHEYEYDTTPREFGGKPGCRVCGRESRHPVHRTSKERLSDANLEYHAKSGTYDIASMAQELIERRRNETGERLNRLQLERLALQAINSLPCPDAEPLAKALDDQFERVTGYRTKNWPHGAETMRLERERAQKASDECCCAERGGGLVCTLPKGHAGQHEAWGARKNLLQSWPAMKADPPRGAKARDFVEYDPYGGVRVDMARYLRSPAGQAQLQALGGKKASERQPCSHGNATGHCQHCLDAL